MRWSDRIDSMFPIRGWALSTYKLHTEEGWDYNQHTFLLTKDGNETLMTLHTPKPKYGVYTIGPAKKVLIEHGVPGADYGLYINQFKGVKIINRHETWAEILRAGLSKGLVAAPDENRSQIEIEKAISTSPWFRRVDPWNLLDVLMTRSLIHIDVSGESRNPQDRLLKDWIGKIDLLSTPQGDRILQTYQLCRDVDTSTGRLTTGKSLFGEGMEACLLFPESSRALRLLVARSAMQYREVLVASEPPMVHHHRYEDWMLSGTHLLTAVMTHPWGYEDCIIVSKAAAAKLQCYRFRTFSLSDTKPISCNLQPGMAVTEGQILARTTNQEGPTHEIKVPDAVMTKVFDVDLLETRVVGQPGYKAHITLIGTYDAPDGTKICTRHGNKGVIRICDKMPKLADGREVEVIISQQSITGKRRCFGTLREMAANKKAFADNTRIPVKHISNILSSENLSKTEYGDYSKMEDGSDVYVGPLYWIRTNKHAQDMASVKDGVPVANFRGLVPDRGKLGGQRLGHDIATVMQAKGLSEAAEALYKANINPKAKAMMQDLCSCLLGIKNEREDSPVQRNEGAMD